MKTAVIVSGQMRSLDKTAEQLRSIYPDAFWVVHAHHDDDSDKAFLLKPNICVIEKQPEIPERREYAYQIGRGCPSIQGQLRQMWANLRAWQIYKKSGHDADCVVRMRPDLVFEIPPEPPANDGVYFPKFANYWGLNDRFAFGSKDLMGKYMTRLLGFDEYIDRGGIFHMETYMGYLFKDVEVKRTNAIFHSLRKDGSLDRAVAKKEWGDIC